jgi:hypothetical protein
VREGERGAERTMSWDEVSRYGIEWHRARGIDLSCVRIPGGAEV